MSVALYMDVHVKIAITRGLRRRGVDGLTAQEDGATTLDEPPYSIAPLNSVGRFSRRMSICSTRHRSGSKPGFLSRVVYAQQRKLSIGRIISELEVVALAGEPADMQNRVEYLPI